MPGSRPPYAPEYRRQMIELGSCRTYSGGLGTGVRAVPAGDP